MNIDKFTIASYDQITGFDRTNGSLDLILDELTDFNLSNSEDKSEITGKGGRVIGTLKKNKRVTGSGTNGFLCGGALAAQTGAEIEDGKYLIRYTDPITVSENKGVTAETAVGAIGNEIGTIYVRNENSAYISGGKKLTQTSGEPGAGEFSYNPDTKTITFFTGEIADGTEVIAFYDANVTGKKISNDADHYSKTLALYIDVTCKDVCDNMFHGQFVIDRADFSGTFDLQGGADPVAQSFEFTSLPNLCTGKRELWRFIIFD